MDRAGKVPHPRGELLWELYRAAGGALQAHSETFPQTVIGGAGAQGGHIWSTLRLCCSTCLLDRSFCAPVVAMTGLRAFAQHLLAVLCQPLQRTEQCPSWDMDGAAVLVTGRRRPTP